VRIDFVSLFPEIILHGLRHGVVGRAEANGRLHLRGVNPRDFCYDLHRKVDDRPFGGEPGMLIKAEPIALAIESLFPDGIGDAAIVSTDPTGLTFDQSAAQSLARLDRVVFVCGHYEGIDQRVLDRFVTHSFSIGDYILTGGELPAMVMADAISRLLPGVLGDAQSLEADSHTDGLLSAPNFTRPSEWRGIAVPEVLLGGDHAKIAQWRREFAVQSTARRRPDLLRKAKLTKKELDGL
jgi:tRNA (guanine37-N1)-methyltransferase